ncbi:hypothetical protein [Tateyamaria omphalii]|uniref:Uncharacterized protein n=1 Tax=Tateyamaria omphalii TaxID=299262 RepID=A0A1P8MWP8_9RHOB|nr:hypothetical protein [Tateyamaria omphalii]APX12349.1 hypothetical protein BWR18_12170 [Tateyamaria omphalii]
MSQTNDNSATGPGTTDDPNQATNTGLPPKDKFKDVPEKQRGEDQTNPDPLTGPGTTSDPNQANLT